MKTTKVVKQRKRNVQYTIVTADEAGLAELVKVVGAGSVVNLFQEYFIARNPLLSKLDLIDKGEYKGEEVYPEQDDEEVIEFDLLEYLSQRKAGGRKTKWGGLKNFVEQAKELLKSAGHPDSEENIRKVATKLKAQHDEQKANMLKELGIVMPEETEEEEEEDSEEDDTDA